MRLSLVDVLGRGVPPCHTRTDTPSTKEDLLAFVWVPLEPPRINMDRSVDLFIRALLVEFFAQIQELREIDIWLRDIFRLRRRVYRRLVALPHMLFG
jgi:hypothetical protein